MKNLQLIMTDMRVTVRGLLQVPHALQVAALHSGNECRIVSNDHFRQVISLTSSFL
jgi:hypothetical protein